MQKELEKIQMKLFMLACDMFSNTKLWFDGI